MSEHHCTSDGSGLHDFVEVGRDRYRCSRCGRARRRQELEAAIAAQVHVTIRRLRRAAKLFDGNAAIAEDAECRDFQEQAARHFRREAAELKEGLRSGVPVRQLAERISRFSLKLGLAQALRRPDVVFVDHNRPLTICVEPCSGHGEGN